MSSEDGTWRSLAVTTQNAVRRAQFQFGEVVAVVGLGILGQLVTQYLAAAGARIIIAIDLAQDRLDLARKHGATHALQMNVQDAEEAVREITEDWMLDVVFDVTGHPAALAPCTQLVRRLGRLVLLGDTPTPGQQHLGPGVLFKSIAILGLHGYAVPEKTSEFTPWTVETMSTVFFDYLSARKDGRVRSGHPSLLAATGAGGIPWPDCRIVLRLWVSSSTGTGCKSRRQISGNVQDERALSSWVSISAPMNPRA